MSLSREWADRLHQFHEELQRQLFCPVGELSFHGFTTKERLRYETAQNHPCVPMPAGTIYGEKFGYAWFFTTLKIPAGLEGKRINLRFDLGGEGLVFVNGLPFGTNRADHIEHLHHHVCDLNLHYSVTDANEVEVSVHIRNTGLRCGYEVVQCYVQDKVASVTLPVRQLKGYKKIRLEPGEDRTITFRLDRDDLSFYTSKGERVFEPGDFTVWIGSDCLHGLFVDFTI